MSDADKNLNDLFHAIDVEANWIEDDDGNRVRLASVNVDGVDITVANGEVSQKALSVYNRLDHSIKQLEKLKKELNKGLILAKESGIPVREGIRNYDVATTIRKSPPYKDMLYEAHRDLGKTDMEIKEMCNTRAKPSVSKRIKVTATK